MTALIEQWAAADPKVKRVWLCGSPAGNDRGADDFIEIALELQPVADSEETFALWVANCEKWRIELQALTGRHIDLHWFDPDEAATAIQSGADEANALVYERAS
ncbi:MAG TPA: hypothetical protein VEV21_08350 [Burkholderiales bacterium]|nr:hypothetical protein [Burkholderiales bacterium]